jgi:hypothetical protein
VQQVVQGVVRLAEQGGEQMADLVAGQRDQPAIAGIATVSFGCGGDGQEGVREHRQDRPAVPGGP